MATIIVLGDAQQIVGREGGEGVFQLAWSGGGVVIRAAASTQTLGRLDWAYDHVRKVILAHFGEWICHRHRLGGGPYLSNCSFAPVARCWFKFFRWATTTRGRQAFG